MLRRIFVAAAMTVSLLGVSAAAQVPAWAHPRPRPAAHLPGVRVVNLHRAYEARLGHIKTAKISGIAYARGKQPAGRKVRQSKGRTCTEPACPVLYNNGPVQLSPHIYLLLWGPNWATDPGQETSAGYLQSFYAGLGVRQPGGQKDNWSTIISQYGDSSGFPIFSKSVYQFVFHDNSVPPTGATPAQIAAEADALAANQDIADLGDAQIVVATQSGTCPQGFDDASCPAGAGNNCGWHSSSNEPYINLPYLPDAGTACGENFVNSTNGTDDGFSLVGGADYANTITDPYPAGGPAPGSAPDPAWVDTADTVSGGEIADKCSWSSSGTTGAPTGDVALSTGSFAMQSLWSNDASACVMSDTVTITSPGSQSTPVGSSVSLQLVGSSSAGYPLTWSQVGLPGGLSLNASSGLITGVPTAMGTFGVTVTAADQAGTSRAVSFNWTITSGGKPIVGPHGKCLDDFASSTANGNKIDIWDCNNTGAQEWIYHSNHTLSVLGSCLSDRKYTGAGTKLVLWSCIGHKNEQWTHRSNGEYVLATNGLCLTDPSNSTVNGTQVEIRSCQNFSDQHWSLPSSP